MSEPIDHPTVEIKWNISPISTRSDQNASLPPNLPDHLAPPENTHLFAILDAALFEWVPETVSSSGLTHACLFEEGPNSELPSYAPWLVQLDPDGSFARNMMTQGHLPRTNWGQSGVLFMHSRCSLPQLRKHFRRILYLPREGDGKRIFLRFWLTDILHDLCQEAANGWTPPHRLFGPEGEPVLIDRFFTAWDNGAALLAVAAPEKTAPGRLLFDARLERTLRGTMRRRFADEMIRHCSTRFPFLDEIPRETQKSAFLQIMDQGNRLGLTQRGPLMVWAEASLLLGIFACDDHATRPILQDCISGASSQMEAAERLHLRAKQHIENCVGQHDRSILARALDRMENVLSDSTGSMADALNFIWPERVKSMGPQAFNDFLFQIDTQIATLGRLSPIRQRAYAILSLFLGIGFQHNPFRQALVAKLFQHRSDDDAAEVLDQMRIWKNRYFEELGAIA